MLILMTYGLLEGRESDGHGLRDLGGRLQQYIDTAVVKIAEWQDDLTGLLRSWHDLGPILMIGHSFGGSAVVDAAAAAPDIPIEYMVLLDPVPTRGWGFANFRDFRISDNVRAATCFWRKPILPPWSLPIRKARCPYQNIYMNLGHSEFNGNPVVWNTILSIASDIADEKCAARKDAA